MRSTLARSRRLIAFDLPGHGDSSDAPDPNRTYTRPGLAEATVELLDQLGITEVIVVGWGLGGHVGLEMLASYPQLRGLMIIGTPPVSRDNIAQGFKAAPHMGIVSRSNLSPAEIEVLTTAIFGPSGEPFLYEAVARSDGRCRQRLFESARAGEGLDHRQTVASSPIPLAVVNGAANRLINIDYLDLLAYASLWEGQCLRLPGLGHAPFWESPEVFNPLLERFLHDVATHRPTVSRRPALLAARVE